MLGFYPITSTEEERKAILRKTLTEYKTSLEAWQKVEQTKKEIEKEVVLTNGHRSDSVGDLGSPSLSTISGSSAEHSRGGTPEPLSSVSPGRDVTDEAPSKSGQEQSPVHVNGDLSHDLPVVAVNGLVTSNTGADDSREPNVHSSYSEDTSDASSVMYESHDRSHDHSPNGVVCASDGAADLLFPHSPEEAVMSSLKLDSKSKVFVKELYNIDKDVPRCDRDYW